MSGWVPVWRRLYEPDHWLAPTKRDPASKRDAWVDIVQLAQHDTYHHGAVRLERGHVLLSVRWLADRWCWTTAKAHRFVRRLCDESDPMLETLRETPDGTVYRVVSYERYAVGRAVHGDTPRDAHRDTTETPPETRTRSNNQSASSTPLGEWLGEYSEKLDGVPDIVVRSLWGLYGPNGTDPKAWGLPGEPPIPEADRPRVLATCLLRLEAEGYDRFNSRLFRRIMQTVIAEGSQRDERPTRRTHARRTGPGRSPGRQSAPRRERPKGQGDFNVD